MRPPWVPAAIIGAAIVLFAGLVAGALILKSKSGDSAASPTTCQAWTQTRLTLRAVPALPAGSNWNTPYIDSYIKLQNAPVGNALEVFEPKIASEPANVAQAAKAYVAARRKQMQTLANHTYIAADGASVDAALGRLNELCGIH